MKIGEARQLYSGKIHEYQNQKRSLSKQKKELEEKIKLTENGKEVYADEAVSLELSYEAVSKKYDEYHNYMEQLMEMHSAYANLESTKQQTEAMAEEAQDLAKIMEVARRIAKGAKVPGKDEQKLMEYSMEMYQAAKSMAMMNEQKEKYKSLWKDDEAPKENPDPMEVADGHEAPAGAPEIVSVSDFINKENIDESNWNCNM